MDIVIAVDKVRLIDDQAVQGQRGIDAADHELLKTATQAQQTFVAAGAMDDQLGNHAVIIGRHAITIVKGAIDANAKASRGVKAGYLAGRGQERFRILGIDTALNGVAGEGDIALLKAKRQACRYADLLAHQIDPRDHF